MIKKGILLVALLLMGALLLAQEEFAAEGQFSKPRFEKREAFLVMGLETKEVQEEEAYMKHWMSFFEIQEKIPEPVGNCIYGITYHGGGFDPQTGKGNVYFVGMEVREAVELPEVLHLHKVPPGYYAVFEHRGDIQNVSKAYEYIFGQWVFESGNKPAPQDMFERYDERFDPGSKDSVVEIWIPIVPRPEYQPEIEQELNLDPTPKSTPEPWTENMPKEQ
ncbi:MAG: GyrI-like domain-containing protein [Candidatus Syntrophosphaera sp.]|nr:GyrI-like domain-containing protein [Candidatus Syntrophosphaera sp.]